MFHFQVAVPSIVESAKDADILIFAIPHQFVENACRQMKGNIKPTAIGMSLIKVLIVAQFNWFR